MRPEAWFCHWRHIQIVILFEYVSLNILQENSWKWEFQGFSVESSRSTIIPQYWLELLFQRGVVDVSAKSRAARAPRNVNVTQQISIRETSTRV